MMNRIGAAFIALPLLAIIAAAFGFGALVVQGQQAPKLDAPYVALGSSYAAGLGLGPRPPDSPILCRRSENGYPQQLARLLNLPLTDMSCSGATIMNVWKGGQYFMEPQIDAIGPDTKLVTLTAGGNDVGYIGDLILLSLKQRGGIWASILGHLWAGPKPAADRSFRVLQNNIIATVREIERRAPHARILVVTYPAVFPPTGTCPQLGIGDRDAALMRGVETKLAATTRVAAQVAGATIVDIASLSSDHNACSAVPWTNGAAPLRGAPFHPNLNGAEAIAQQIETIPNGSPNDGVSHLSP